MNLFAFLSRGTGEVQRRKENDLAKRTEETRQQWLAALRVDEIRAWLDIGQASAQTLRGLSIVLTLASFCKLHADLGASSPDVSVIRGAMRALGDCANLRDCVISADDARAISPAVDRARAIVEAASHEAIQSAAQSMRQLSKLD